MTIAATYPLSTAQMGLWLAYQMEPRNRALFMTSTYRVQGHLDLARLEKAIACVTVASDALRTCFATSSDGPIQQVRSSVRPTFQVMPASKSVDADHLERVVREWLLTPFDIERDVLFDTLVVEHSASAWTWHTRFSHLVIDGYAGNMYTAAVADAYTKLQDGTDPDMSYVGNYATHIASELELRKTHRWMDSLRYWQDRYARPVSPIFSPGRGSDRDHVPLRAIIEREPYRELQRVCGEDGISTGAALLAVVLTIAARHYQRSDIAVGVATHNRPPEHRLTLGMFSGYVPLRADVSAQEPGLVLARAVHAQLRSELPHAHIPAHEIPTNNGGYAPLFDLVFSHVRTGAAARMPDAKLTLADGDGADPNRAFLLVIEPEGQQPVQVRFSFRPDATDADEAKAFLGQFTRLVACWPAIRHLALDQVQLVDTRTPGLLAEFSTGTRKAIGPQCDVLRRFREQVAREPGALAVVDPQSQYTYCQLADRSSQLANLLQADGVRAGDTVALRLERSFDLVSGVLATLQLNAAYLPVDAAIPLQRARHMLGASGAKVLLTRSADAGALAGAGLPAVCLDKLDCSERLRSEGEPAAGDQLAYVMYTSGSSGEPKGVQITRAALANVIAAFERELAVTRHDVMLSTTGISFDIFGLELFLPLCCGGVLVLAERDRLLDEGYLEALASKHRASLFQATPSLLRNLLDTGWHPREDMRILVGGEAVTVELVQRLTGALELLNVYGPTETTIWASVDRIESQPVISPPIGRPLWNTQLHVLNGRLEPVPMGVPGELYIAGIQLARGYASRPDLTAERFLPDPFVPGQRMYRTGDLARWRDDGRLEYLGRADQQVKIHGYRIEPAEVQETLASHPAVASAAVVPRDDLPGGTQLVGYFTTALGWERYAGDDEVARRQIARWQEVYDRSYARSSDGRDTATVWTNSFTGKPYSEQAMREWTEATVHRLAGYGARRVLEIGCGSGLLLRPLAALADRYVGTDFSPHALELLRSDADLPPHVELHQLRADGIDALSGRVFDLVVINSVVQYFPSLSYLRDFVAKAVALLAPGGRVFIGDVRNLALLPAFHAAAALRHTDEKLDMEQLRRRVQARCEEERELCLAPALFESLAHQHGLRSAQPLARRGCADTEMNNFRFDAVLRRAAPGLAPCARVEFELPWHAVGKEGLAAALEAREGKSFRLHGVPDARVWAAVCALRGEAADARTPAHPEELHAQAGDRWVVAVAPTRDDGTFDALFVPPGVDSSIYCRATGAVKDVAPLANAPLQSELLRALTGLLRKHLAAQLPDYMVPAFFVWLPRLPTTSSGKLDLHALPRPVAEPPPQDNQPTDDLEIEVAAAMADVLGLSAAPRRGASFFQLGGHSLAAARLAARLRERYATNIGLRDVMENPTVEELAATLRVRERGGAEEIAHGSYRAGDKVALSHAQEALWFLDRLQEGSATYNIPSAVRVNGTLNLQLLARALGLLIERHTVLRTVYTEVEGSPAATILPAPQELAVHVEMVDGDVQLRLAAFVQQRFDLARDIVLRAGVFHEAQGTQVLALVVHHIAADALSFRLIWNELREYYEQLSTGLDFEPAPGLQYADFARWQREQIARGQLQRQREWWRSHLAAAPESLDLPRDRARPKTSRHRGETRSFAIDAALRSQVEQLALQLGVTPFSVLLGSYAALLARLAGQPNVVVGIPVANRQRAGLANVVGAFMNTLPLLLSCDAPNSAALVRSVYDVLKLALQHGEWPFDEMVRALGLRRSSAQMPVFQTLFTFLEQEDEPASFAGLRATPLPMETAGARCDLTLRLAPQREGGYRGSFEFDCDLFAGTTIERWIEHFQCLLRALVQSPALHPLDLDLLPAQQRQRLLAWGTGDEAADCADVVALFEEQARRRPHATAVVSGGIRLSYAGLHESSSRLATRLRSLGVGREDVVGVHIDRSVHLLVAMLAVLKAGAAYLPLDVTLPEGRLAQVLQASGAKLLLGTGNSAAQVGDGLLALAVDRLDEAGEGETTPRSFAAPPTGCVAYVIYTSGSTGEPKGVQVSRGSLAAFVRALTETIGIRDTDRIMSVASISFDMFLSEVIPFLCAGARVVLADRGRLLDHDYTASLCAQEEVTCMIMTPSLSRNLLAQGWRPSGGFRMMSGGEPLPREVAEQLCEFATVWNRYGPTEATIAQTACKLQAPLRAAPAIGQPFRGSQTLVLDKRMNLAPVGAAGELYIGGVQLARGYLGRPGLTAERFIASPFQPGERLYRTGDVARWNADGELEHLGRCDRQVKLRGYRIELGEIEAVLLRHGSLAAAVVVPQEAAAGDTRLVAYVVPGTGNILDAPALKSHVQQQLPAYMAPAAYVAIDRLPANRNGKLDVAALPRPQWDAAAATADVHDDLERAVAATMAKILGSPDVPGPDADFFALGGHSLTAVRLLAALRRTHGVDVPLKTFYDEPTVAGLARLLRGGVGERITPLVDFGGGRGKLPLFLVHGGDGSALNLRELGRRLQGAAHVWGIDSAYLCGIAPHPRLDIGELASFYADHVCSVVHAGGPVAVGGWSFGGAVAFEMARELRQRGYRVVAAFAIDSAIGRPSSGATDDQGTEMETMLARQLQAAGHAPAEIRAMLDDTRPDSFHLRLHKVYTAHKAAAEVYTPVPAAGDFALFSARDGAWTEAWLRETWTPLVRGRFTHQAMAGDHWSVLREPHVAVLADAILDLLRVQPSCAEAIAS